MRKGRRHCLRQMAGPGQLAIMRLGRDQDRMGREYRLPEVHDLTRGVLALGAGRTDIDDRVAKEIKSAALQPERWVPAKG